MIDTDKAKSNFSMVMPYMSMSNMVVQLILDAPVEHPEQIGQLTFEDVNVKTVNI